MQKLDSLISAVCLVFVWPKPGFGERILVPIEEVFSRFAKTARLSVATIGVAVLLARVALLPPLPSMRTSCDFFAKQYP